MSGRMVDGRFCRYSTVDVAKDVRKALKSEFPDCKFSVTSKYFSGGSEISVYLMAAPFRIFRPGFVPEHGRDFEESGHHDVNHFYLRPDDAERAGYTKEAADVLRRVTEIANAENWDNSDSMTDYFDVNYYFHLSVGKWDKPFVFTGVEEVSAPAGYLFAV